MHATLSYFDNAVHVRVELHDVNSNLFLKGFQMVENQMAALDSSSVHIGRKLKSTNMRCKYQVWRGKKRLRVDCFLLASMANSIQEIGSRTCVAPAVFLCVAASAAILVLFVGGSPPFCMPFLQEHCKVMDLFQIISACFRPVIPGYG